MRRRNPHDRRRVDLVPTEHAREEAWRALMPLLKDIGALNASLADADRNTVTRYLTDLLAIYRRHASG